MDKEKKAVKSSRLKKFERKFKIIDKTGNYIEKELFKNKKEKERLREIIAKEKKAISLTNKAKRLRSPKKE